MFGKYRSMYCALYNLTNCKRPACMKTGTHMVKYLDNMKVYFARPIVDILNVIDKHKITTVLFVCENSLGLNRGRNRGIIDCPHHYVAPSPLIELSE